jgi:anti-anti-sigma factor
MRPGGLEITSIHDGRVLTLVLHGELDMTGVSEVKRALAEGADGHEVVLDLRGLTFIDSSGIQLLVELQAREGPLVRFTEPGRHVGHTLAIAGVRERLRWVERPDGSSR